jgi:hypothetical protein
LIYVRRDPSLIPEAVLKIAERAQAHLETLPAADRAAFIKKKSHIWRRFARYLAKMSYGKCWYSESPDPQSFFDVDHFRPKGEAIRSETEKDDGYPWLAFFWQNFRYSAQRSNRLSKDETTDAPSGKGSWFPLVEGSQKACWDNRCEAHERPILLDPTVRRDADLIDVKDDGRMDCSRTCVGTARVRVTRSIELYGLNLPRLVGARKEVMRRIEILHTNMIDLLTDAHVQPRPGDENQVDGYIDLLRTATLSSSPYSRAARTQLILMGMAQLCAQAEDAIAAP